MARPSRYDDVGGFVPLPDGSTSFAGVLPRRVPTPDGVVEHVVQSGDTLQALAHQYYNDTRLWYHILDANPQLFCGSDLVLWRGADAVTPEMAGLVIVIPGAPV